MDNTIIKEKINFLQINTLIGQVAEIVKEFCRFYSAHNTDIANDYFSHYGKIQLSDILGMDDDTIILSFFVEPEYDYVYNSVFDGSGFHVESSHLYEVIPVVRFDRPQEFAINFSIVNDYDTKNDTLPEKYRHGRLSVHRGSEEIDIKKTLELSGKNFIDLIQNQKTLLNCMKEFIMSVEDHVKKEKEEVYSECIATSIFLNRLSFFLERLPVGATMIEDDIHIITAGHRFRSRMSYSKWENHCLGCNTYDLGDESLILIGDNLI